MLFLRCKTRGVTTQNLQVFKPLLAVARGAADEATGDLGTRDITDKAKKMVLVWSEFLMK